MLLSKNRATILKNTTYPNADISCRRSGFLARNMLAASQESLVGQTLLTRPGLVLAQDDDGNDIYFRPFAPNHDDLDHIDVKHIVHSPMMYIADERVINGVSCYIAIILNAPQMDGHLVRDDYPNASSKNQKLPIFYGGPSLKTISNTLNSCAKHALTKTKSLKLLLPRQSHWLFFIPEGHGANKKCKEEPYVIVDDPEMVATIISFDTTDSLLAFEGQCIIPKTQLMHDLAKSDLYLTPDLSPSIALSPYAETKYLQAFQHAGFSIQDIHSLPLWAKATQQSFKIKH